MSSKILFVAPDNMKAALERESAKRNTPMSALIRIAVSDWLYRQGERVDPVVEWGGYRGTNNEDKL